MHNAEQETLLVMKNEELEKKMRLLKEEQEEERRTLKQINESEISLTNFFADIVSKNEKRIVKIKYDSGSSPGEIRSVIPHRVNHNNGVLYAHCVESKKNKSYYIKYIIVVHPGVIPTKEKWAIFKGCIWLFIIAISIFITIRMFS